MPVARLGTYILHQQSSNGSIAVNVPADAVACVVIVTGYPGNSGVPMFSGLLWDGAGLDFTLIRTQYWAPSNAQIGAYCMTSASAGWPGSGAKTLYYTAPGYSEGYNILVLFYGGVDAANPIVGSDGSNNIASNWTSNISGVGAADMGIVAAYNWQASGTVVNSNGQTQIVNTALYNYSVIAAGEKAATGALTVGRTSGDIIPLAIVLRAAAGGSVYTETLTSTVASVASVDDRQTYLEAASVLIQSGGSVAAVQTMLEAIITVAASTATATDVAQMVEQCLTTVQSASSVTDAVAYVETLLTTIQGTANASDIQQAVETVQTDIQSAATVADVAQLVESLLTTIQGTATVSDTLIGGGQTFAETVLVTATSAAEAYAAQSYVDGVTAVAQGIGTATELQLYLDALTATGQAIAAVTDRQLYYDNVAIMAVSGASVVEIGAYIEQVQAAATGIGSVVDVIQGAFVGRYLFVTTVPPRRFTSEVRPRSFTSTVRARC